tara:strand:+ start:918 stop:1964 length:1047 start_codon:yes stop_codon:yes gene_type:complete
VNGWKSRLKQIGIVGGTGYTGVELLRMLASHRGIEISCLTSRSEAGKTVASLYPWLSHLSELSFEEPSGDALSSCDLVFYATPNKIAMTEAQTLLERGVRVIDLAADFRFADVALWEAVYGGQHSAPELLQEAVYGLPEKYRHHIAEARIVGNPGCYPTATALALMPLVETKALRDSHVIVDGKSGASGAGRSARADLIVAEASDNFHTYAADGHRHEPEMAHQISQMGQNVSVTFVPHLLPMIRGIEVTIYVSTSLTVDDARQLFQSRYDAEPMISVASPGTYPETRWVRGSNRCVIGLYQQRPGQLIISSVIDNLVKGAAGQAIQNMNLMLGFNESDAIPMDALSP